MPTPPYKTSDYLRTAAEKAAYLNEALATEDPQLWLLALNNLQEADSFKSEWLNSAYPLPFQQSFLTELNRYLGQFQLK
jgi:hypothetical protein